MQSANDIRRTIANGVRLNVERYTTDRGCLVFICTVRDSETQTTVEQITLQTSGLLSSLSL